MIEAVNMSGKSKKKMPSMDRKALKIIGVCVKITGTDWHTKVKHKSASMQAGKNYTIAFWAKAKKGMRFHSVFRCSMIRGPFTKAGNLI